MRKLPKDFLKANSNVLPPNIWKSQNLRRQKSGKPSAYGLRFAFRKSFGSFLTTPQGVARAHMEPSLMECSTSQHLWHFQCLHHITLFFKLSCMIHKWHRERGARKYAMLKRVAFLQRYVEWKEPQVSGDNAPLCPSGIKVQGLILSLFYDNILF